MYTLSKRMLFKKVKANVTDIANVAESINFQFFFKSFEVDAKAT